MVYGLPEPMLFYIKSYGNDDLKVKLAHISKYFKLKKPIFILSHFRQWCLQFVDSEIPNYSPNLSYDLLIQFPRSPAVFMQMLSDTIFNKEVFDPWFINRDKSPPWQFINSLCELFTVECYAFIRQYFLHMGKIDADDEDVKRRLPGHYMLAVLRHGDLTAFFNFETKNFVIKEIDKTHCHCDLLPCLCV